MWYVHSIGRDYDPQSIHQQFAALSVMFPLDVVSDHLIVRYWLLKGSSHHPLHLASLNSLVQCTCPWMLLRDFIKAGGLLPAYLFTCC